MAEFHDHVILNELLTTREQLLKEYDAELEKMVDEFRDRLSGQDHETEQFDVWILEISREMKEKAKGNR